MLEGGARQDLAHLERPRRMLPESGPSPPPRRGAGQRAASAEDGQRSYAVAERTFTARADTGRMDVLLCRGRWPRPYTPRMNRGRPLGYLQVKTR